MAKHDSHKDGVTKQEKRSDGVIGFVACLCAILTAWCCNEYLHLSAELTCLIAIGTLAGISVVGVIITDRRSTGTNET